MARLDDHTVRRHTLHCGDCETIFLNRAFLDQHYREIHLAKRLHCHECDRIFLNLRDLSEHRVLNSCQEVLILGEMSSKEIFSEMPLLEMDGQVFGDSELSLEILNLTPMPI
jgi:hypothetical protein